MGLNFNGDILDLYHIYIYIIVGARGPRMKLKSYSIGAGMPWARGGRSPEERKE